MEPIDWTKATAAEKILEGLKNTMPAEKAKEAPIDFLMVAGDGREDEVIFRWANHLRKDDYVKNVTTVSLGSRNTEATSTLAQGVSGESRTLLLHFNANKSLGVLTILQKLAAL